MMRGALQWSHVDEEKNHSACCSMIKHWRMWWWWEKFLNDLISMKRKRTSDVGQWSNIGECLHLQRNCSMISSRWREKGHRMLVNDQTLANVFIVREIVQWSHLDEEKKDIGCWSMIKHWRMSSFSEKLFNDLISMKRKRTSDVGQWSNIGECYDDKRNCSMISSRWREKGHRLLANDHTLANIFLLREVHQSSRLDVAKKNSGCWLLSKHWRMSVSYDKVFNDLIPRSRKRTSDNTQWWKISECIHFKWDFSMILSPCREKALRMLKNHQR